MIKAGRTRKGGWQEALLFIWPQVAPRAGARSPRRQGAGAGWGGSGLLPLPAPTRRSSFSQQLPRMIYVASREGLPGFLFHLGEKKKKGTLLEFYQGARIKLTAAFCFVFKDLPFGAPPETRGGRHSEQRAAAPPARENKTISLSPCTFQARPFLRSRHLRAPPAPGSSEQRFMALGCSHPGRSFASPSAKPPSPHHGRPRVWLRAGTEGPMWQGNGV